MSKRQRITPRERARRAKQQQRDVRANRERRDPGSLAFADMLHRAHVMSALGLTPKRRPWLDGLYGIDADRYSRCDEGVW